jgi:hypothetical protein
MKKTYIIPVTECVTIHTVNMVAASSLTNMSADGGSVETYSTELTNESSDSRGVGFWGDED